MKRELTDFEAEQQLAREMKPHLRFNPGDVVFFKTDGECKNPMLIKSLLDGTWDEDYVCTWFDSQKIMHSEFFFDHALIKDDREEK